MRKDAQPSTGGIYRPRNPQASPLYQCVRRHSDDLDAAGLVHRPVEAEVLKRFLDCGECLEDNVLAPVPHRQYVFALPKLIRPFFRHRRRYLGELCRLVAPLHQAAWDTTSSSIARGQVCVWRLWIE